MPVELQACSIFFAQVTTHQVTGSDVSVVREELLLAGTWKGFLQMHFLHVLNIYKHCRAVMGASAVLIYWLVLPVLSNRL